jgi:hypothetical protein
VRLYENLRSLPRARLVSHVLLEPDDARALALLHPGKLARDSVIVDRPVEWPTEGTQTAEEETIEWVADGYDEVELRVSTPRRAILVLADLHWPGWRVLVDGEERPLLRVDYLLRGVALAPGTHRVVFRYEPASIRWGGVLSASTAAILCVGAALALRRRADAP